MVLDYIDWSRAVMIQNRLAPGCRTLVVISLEVLPLSVVNPRGLQVEQDEHGENRRDRTGPPKRVKVACHSWEIS